LRIIGKGKKNNIISQNSIRRFLPSTPVKLSGKQGDRRSSKDANYWNLLLARGRKH